MKVGNATVEVTTNRGGTRGELRDFAITVVQQRERLPQPATPRIYQNE